jgi:polysaccharide biosynthesis protein PslH
MRILMITHNIPYPPNKGEKIRTFHFIRELSKSHSIFLCALCRTEIDPACQTALEEFCDEVHIFPLNRWLSRLRALLALMTFRSMTLGYFFSPKLKRLLPQLVAKKGIDLIFASCSSTGDYLRSFSHHAKVIDFMDVDSEKWKVFALASGFPSSMIYRAEHQRLRKIEYDLTDICGASVVTTERERVRLAAINPAAGTKIRAIRMGVDLDYFRSRQTHPSTLDLIFVGQLDYLPNIDAVLNFYHNILPLIRRQLPKVQFKIIGRNPHPSISQHCQDAYISGEVPDVRPHLEGAAVFVAPFRMAFGVQSKVLEAMAVGVPVVATSQVAEGLEALPGRDLLVEDSPQRFSDRVVELLQNRQLAEQIALNARQYVREAHDWEKNVFALEEILTQAASTIPILSETFAPLPVKGRLR